MRRRTRISYKWISFWEATRALLWLLFHLWTVSCRMGTRANRWTWNYRTKKSSLMFFALLHVRLFGLFKKLKIKFDRSPNEEREEEGRGWRNTLNESENCENKKTLEVEVECKRSPRDFVNKWQMKRKLLQFSMENISSNLARCSKAWKQTWFDLKALEINKRSEMKKTLLARAENVLLLLLDSIWWKII